MIKLWPFQEQAVVACRNEFKQKKKKLILCSPCGSGKTVMSCYLIKEAILKGKSVTVLVDRKEILDQFAESLSSFGVYPEFVTAGSRPTEVGIYLGMVESYVNRMSAYQFLKNIDFFIFDEAHSATYFKVIEKLDSPYILGLTATPVLTGTKARLNEYYDGIVELAKVEQLIQDGFLCNAKTYSVDLADVRKLKKAKGDFTEQSQLAVMDHSEVFSGVLQNYQKICPDAKFICYNINVAHSMKMAAYFNFMGVKCRHVDGTTDPAYRKETFAMLRSGQIQGVHNYGICTTGFDEPSIECIIQNFATDSMTKHIQTAGRGARISPGKTDFSILDMGMNYSRHGLWNSNKDWKDIFANPYDAGEKDRQESEAVANISCTTCGYVLNGVFENCPICGASITEILRAKAQRKDREPTAAELKLIRAQAMSQLPVSLQNRSVGSMSKKELVAYADHMGYNAKWVYLQLGLKGRYGRTKNTQAT